MDKNDTIYLNNVNYLKVNFREKKGWDNYGWIGLIVLEKSKESYIIMGT